MNASRPTTDRSHLSGERRSSHLLTSWSTQTARAAAGDLDPTFGSNGRVKTDFDRTNDIGYGMAIQPDGKVIVAGISFVGNSAEGGDFAVARYNANGTLDNSFGVGGKVATDFGLTETASSVMVSQTEKSSSQVGRIQSSHRRAGNLPWFDITRTDRLTLPSGTTVWSEQLFLALAATLRL